MKVRVYSPFFPYPATEGAFQVVCDQLRCLHESGWDVELVTWKDGPATIARRLRTESMQRFPGEIWITSLRDLEFAKARAMSWKTRSFSAQMADQGGCAESSLDRAIRVLKSVASGSASPEVFYYPEECDLRKRLGFADVAIYHYSFSHPWFVRKGAGEKVRVVHFHNLESELFGLRMKESRNGLARWLHRRNMAILKSHERDLAKMADELWFVSRRDLEIYRKMTGATRLRWVRPGFDPLVYRKRQEIFHRNQARHSHELCLGFLGILEFKPNRDSVEWLLTQLAPKLWERGFSGKLLIVGKSPPAELVRMGQPFPFVEWLGNANDLEEFWSRLSLLVIPHVSGSGVRIKLLEAVASGIPVLANSAAMEGLGLDRNAVVEPVIRVKDQPADWADLILSETPFRSRIGLMKGEAKTDWVWDLNRYQFLKERAPFQTP